MASDMTDERAERLARNEAQYRSVNEEIAVAAHRFDSQGLRFSFICECADPECQDLIELTTQEYEQLRADAARFGLRPGHERPEIERVVGEIGGVRVVEKIGRGRDVAAALDPRSA